MSKETEMLVYIRSRDRDEKINIPLKRLDLGLGNGGTPGVNVLSLALSEELIVIFQYGRESLF